MPPENGTLPIEIYQLKATLKDTRPPIWRSLLVPSDFTLSQLHGVLQVAMGWEDRHLHEFQIGDQNFGIPDPEASFMAACTAVSDKRIRLSKVLPGVGAKGWYLYDFGDEWVLRILVEKVLAPEPGAAYPACIGGRLNSPPEDCGGTYGYYNLLEAIKDPEHDQHELLVEWIGEAFDPDQFLPEKINRKLAPAQRRWLKKLKPV